MKVASGQGNFNDKTDLTVDPVTGNVYAAWSDFRGNGCNEILFSRSTDHGTSSLNACFDLTGGLDQNIYGATITP